MAVVGAPSSEAERRQPLGLTLAEGAQWLTFAVASFVSVPLLVAGAFRLDQAGTIMMVQSTLIIGAVGALWQLFWGHRYIVNMVPSLLWAAVAIGLARLSASAGPLTDVISELQGALLVTGLVLAVLALTGVVRRLLPLLTPLTMAAYLLVLVVQSAPEIMADALAVGVYGPGPDATATLASLGLIIMFLIFSHPRRPTFLRTLALPLALLCGWGLMALIGLALPAPQPVAGAGLGAGSAGTAAPWVQVPLLPWGPPTFRLGVVLAILPNLLPLLAGQSSAMVAVGQALGHKKIEPQRIQQGMLGVGLFTAVAAASSVIGPVLQPEGAGFIAMTGMRRRAGFAVGMVLLLLIGLSPVLIGLLAVVPRSLFAAALLAAFSAMVGISVNTLLMGPTTSRELTIFGIAVLFGIGARFLPTEALLALPVGLRYFFSNGVIVAVLTALILEHLAFPKPWVDQSAN